MSSLVEQAIANLKKEKLEKLKEIEKQSKERKLKKVFKIDEYELFIGDRFQFKGSLEEIAEREGITVITAQYYASPSYKERIRWNGRKAKVIYKVARDKENIDKVNKIVSLYNMGFGFDEALKIVS